MDRPAGCLSEQLVWDCIHAAPDGELKNQNQGTQTRVEGGTDRQTFTVRGSKHPSNAHSCVRQICPGQSFIRQTDRKESGMSWDDISSRLCFLALVFDLFYDLCFSFFTCLSTCFVKCKSQWQKSEMATYLGREAPT